MNQITPPPGKKERNSNLELFRIIVMFMIVAHHYVVNSGVIQEARADMLSANSIFMTLFGMWGKTGINCFVMITGWFMCTSWVTVTKFLRLVFEVIFYGVVIECIFLLSGYAPFSERSLMQLLPVQSVGAGFTSCFVLFYMLIPFLNVWVRRLTRQQHAMLVVLLLGIYTVLSSFIRVTFNYVTWFTVLYVLMAYIRFHGLPWEISHRKWGRLTLLMIGLSVFSVLAMEYAGVLLDRRLPSWGLVSDSNKALALLTALCSFMWFKDLKIKSSKFINTVAASTFGVLLIHANSDTMRRWLWRDTLENVQVFHTDWFALHALLSCIVIFALCIAIDRLRIKYLEQPLFERIDARYGAKFRNFEARIYDNE